MNTNDLKSSYQTLIKILIPLIPINNIRQIREDIKGNEFIEEEITDWFDNHLAEIYENISDLFENNLPEFLDDLIDEI